MRAFIAGVLMLVGSAAPVLAQEQPAKPDPAPAPTPEAKKEQPPAEPPRKVDPKQPSLDDLLGIPKDKPNPKAKPRPEAVDPSKAELDRKLSAREVAEQFKQAVDLMGETADRLQVSRDTGLATQRMQEDILRKLDQMIKAAEQNQKQSKQNQPQPQSQRDPSQQPASQQQRNPEGHQPAPDTMQPPPGQDPKLNPAVGARGTLWGNLPPHLRDALLQGPDDKYSILYRDKTAAYYRRLAEEANK
jgi:hypothetical protein